MVGDVDAIAVITLGCDRREVIGEVDRLRRGMVTARHVRIVATTARGPESERTADETDRDDAHHLPPTGIEVFESAPSTSVVMPVLPQALA